MLDWTKLRAQYTTNYTWSVASLNTDSLGNVITNSHSRQLNGDFTFTKLYAKWKYLKKIMNPPAPKKPDNKTTPKNTLPDPKKPDDKNGKDKKNKEYEPSLAERYAIRPFLLLQRARLTYQEDYNTSIPGFLGQSKILGQDFKLGTAPGWDFIFGLQPTGAASTTAWLDRAAAVSYTNLTLPTNREVYISDGPVLLKQKHTTPPKRHSRIMIMDKQI